jgi:DNA-binding transcriptional ArsR family regulator
MCIAMHMNDDSAIRDQGDNEDETPALDAAAVAAARQRMAAGPAPEDLARLFAILGDPTRVRLLAALAAGELCVQDLAAATGVNRSTVSHQLRILRQHRIARPRRAGKQVYYALDDDHVAALMAMGGAHVAETRDEPAAGEEKA